MADSADPRRFSNPWKMFRQRFPILGSILLLMTLVVSGAMADWIDPSIPTNLQAVVERAADSTGVGIGLRVEDPVLGTGSVVAGVAQLEPPVPLKPSDRFRIASCSKTFTAASILLLKESGLIDLDQTVAHYLPQYDIPSNNVITVRQLLTHTSGLPDHNNDTNIVEQAIFAHPETYFPATQLFAIVRSLNFHFAPGTQYKYCDTGFYILHLLVEQLNTNGWSYAQFVENRLINPLGLTNTFVPQASNGWLQFIPGDHAWGYIPSGGIFAEVTEINQSWDVGCGGMVSSLEDLCKWGRALYGGSVLSSNSLAEMLAVTPQSRAARTAYGMGLMYNQALGYGHDGATYGYFTRFAYDPYRRTAYAFLDNSEDLAAATLPESVMREGKRALHYSDIESPRYTNTAARMSTVITNLMAQYGVPAASIALVDSNRVVWARGFGLASVEEGTPASSETVYMLGSISKTLTTALLMKQVDAGRVNLDVSITNYLTEFSMLPRFVGGITGITSRLMLNHHSGLPGDIYNGCQGLVYWDGYTDWLLDYFKSDYPMTQPGHIATYCNSGFVLAGEIAARAQNTNLIHQILNELFRPLNMRHTSFLPILENLATGYINGQPQPVLAFNMPATGGAYTTVEDMALFIMMMLGEGVGLTGVRALSADVVTNQMAKASPSALDIDNYFQPGPGWDSVSDPAMAYAGRTWIKDGDTGSFGALCELLPDQQLGVIVMLNRGHASKYKMVRECLREAVLEKTGLTNSVAPLPAAASMTEPTQISGFYAGSKGLSRIDMTDSNNLDWVSGLESGAATTTRLSLANGAYRNASNTNAYWTFTNITWGVTNHTVMLLHGNDGSSRVEFIYDGQARRIIGTRFQPAPLSEAWLNRVGQSWTYNNLLDQGINWYAPKMEIRETDGVLLMVQDGDSFPLLQVDDHAAFSIALDHRGDSSLRVITTNGHEEIIYGGYRAMRAADMPAVIPFSNEVNTLAFHSTDWRRLDVKAGVQWFFTAADTSGVNQVDMWLYGEEDGLMVPLANETGVVSWQPEEDGTLYLAVTATNEVTYRFRAYNYTGVIAQVSALISNRMEALDMGGCGFAFVDGAQTVVQTGYGLADKEHGIPADEGTVFMIGSCSKTFGGVAAMQLVEQGLLDLDAPLTDALPSFSINQRFPGNIITPRTILTHHSGMPGDIFNGMFNMRRNLNLSSWMTNYLAGEYTLMPTNTFWAYNNSGFYVLSLLIEHLSGMPAEEYARTNLFFRMGMTSSSLVRDTEYINAHIARPYEEGELKADEYCEALFAGAILSTPADMACYIRTLLSGGMGDYGQVISNETLQAMMVQQNADIPLDHYITALPMGLGFVVGHSPLGYMGRMMWHDGATTYFRSLLRVAPDAGLGCFISWGSSEGEQVNPEIIDSTLKWAYEAKTGIAPPSYGPPAEYPPATAPANVLAWAEGTFVTSSGYERFATNAAGLHWTRNASSEVPVETNLIYRADGWFTLSNSIQQQLLFTQVSERVVAVLKYFTDGLTNMSVYAEKLGNVTPLNAAWSNRLGRWWAVDMQPYDIGWLAPDENSIPMFELSAKDGLLMLDPMLEGSKYVMGPSNDVLSFALGLGRNRGAALRVVTTYGEENLIWMGMRYRPLNSIPVLAAGSSTNGTAVGDETTWLYVPAATGTVHTIDLTTESEVMGYIYDTNCMPLGTSGRSHAYRFDETNSQPFLVAVVRNGTNGGPYTLAIHTNRVPFYQALAPSQWPAAFTARSNLFPRTELGYVFVPECHTNDTGNLLKLAVAKMSATNSPAEPLVFISGGPGNWSIFSTYQYYFKNHFADYDVYMVDQRGVGFSQPNLNSRDDEDLLDMLYRVKFLELGDPYAVHTVESARDLEDVHSALNLGSINLWGLSYGTMLAEEVMRLNPPWLRSVILDGILAPNMPPYRGVGAVQSNALESLFRDVAADPVASKLYPRFDGSFYAFALELQMAPVPVYYNGQMIPFTGQMLIEYVIYQLLFSDLGQRERIPNIIWRASSGEFQALAELFSFPNKTPDMMDNGYTPNMNRLVLRHDFLPFDSIELATNANSTLWEPLRSYANYFVINDMSPAMQIQDGGSADATFTQKLTSAIATLCINGFYDPQCGTNWASEVASQLPNSFLALFPTVGHGVLQGGECPLQVIREFLADPTQEPDLTCINSMALNYPAPYPTNTPWLVEGQTVTNVFTESGSAFWCRFNAVSGLLYSVQAGPGGSPMVNLEDTNAAYAGAVQNGLWHAPKDGTYYTWIVALTTGVATLDWSYPLLMRDLHWSDSGAVLQWQARTNVAYEVWTTTNLVDGQSFMRVGSNLVENAWFRSFTNNVGTELFRFYQIRRAVP
jgi:CubicO group peptidase (beta-lactamase class C family)/pimeloyl-ACP methyl ester carboxylesterase